MIYLVTEQMMNGTVTMDIGAYGIEANNLDEAYEKLEKRKWWNRVTYMRRTKQRIDFGIPAPPGGLAVWGSMKNEPLEVIK